MLVITPTFTPEFTTNFGVRAAAAKAGWIAAANIFSANFSDNIHINITVNAVPGTEIFGRSDMSFIQIPYSVLRARLVADAKSPSDFIAVGASGSMSVADPTGGAGTWWLMRAQAKALGVIPDDQLNDGITTFGTGFPFTFTGPIALETYDFQGIAAHEISEVMGRLGLSGDTFENVINSYTLIDNFSYTGPGTKGLRGGPGNYFSINNGTTLLKLWNDPTTLHDDSRDWAPGTDDSFNNTSFWSVPNPVSPVDLQLMDVIGYDLVPRPPLDGIAHPTKVCRGGGVVHPGKN